MIDAATKTALSEAFPALAWSEFRGDTRAVVPREVLFNVFKHLRDELGFDLMVDITCVDYLNYRDAEDRFGLVYLLPTNQGRMKWAIYPAAALLAMAVLVMAAMGQVATLLWPTALILAGVYMVYRTLRPRHVYSGEQHD